MFLLDASTGLEDPLLGTWARRCGPAGAPNLALAPSRLYRRSHTTDPAMSEVMGVPRGLADIALAAPALDCFWEA